MQYGEHSKIVYNCNGEVGAETVFASLQFQTEGEHKGKGEHFVIAPRVPVL